MPEKQTSKNAGIGKGTPGPGRKKGVPNRTTTLLKDAILMAAQKAGGDGPEGITNYLTTQAIENPGPFLSLLGKVLPVQLQGDPNAPIRHAVEVRIVDAQHDQARSSEGV